MRIDAHQHFWSLERTDYGWLTPATGSIYRDFLPDDLKPLLVAGGIDATILVQAAPTVAETEYLLALAEQTDFVIGVVGWVDFEARDAAEQIGTLAARQDLVGLRPMIQDIADDAWMLRPQLAPAFDAISKYELTFDALTFPRHLRNLLVLLDRYPAMQVVIDHGSKPRIREGAFHDWAADMAELARSTSAFCKLSGLVTEAAPGWTVEDLKPYVAHLLDVFTPSRLIWGSDWPVVNLAGGYDAWLEATDELLRDLSPTEKATVMGNNAVRAYRLPLP